MSRHLILLLQLANDSVHLYAITLPKSTEYFLVYDTSSTPAERRKTGHSMIDVFVTNNK